MSEHIERPRGTLDWLPPRVALRQHVVDTAIEAFERAGFRQIVTPVFEDTGAVRAHRGRDLGRRLQGDVLVPRSQRPRADAAPRGHGAGRAGVPRARAGARAAARAALVLRADVPLRGAAGGSLPRALAVRGRGDRVGRPRRRCRGDRGAGGVVPRARARRPRAAPQLDRRSRLPASLPGCARRLPRAAARSAVTPSRRSASTATRCASWTRRTSATRRSSRTRRASRSYLCDACRAHFDEVRAHLDGARGGPRRRRCARARARLLHPDGLGVHPGRRRTRAGRRSREAGATTASPSRSAASGRRAWASAAASSESCSHSRARARAPVLRGCDWFCAVDCAGRASHRRCAAGRGAGAVASRAEMDLAGRSLKGQLRHAQRLGARVVSVVGADEWARRRGARWR